MADLLHTALAAAAAAHDHDVDNDALILHTWQDSVLNCSGTLPCELRTVVQR
jgi:hypothetical protein